LLEEHVVVVAMIDLRVKIEAKYEEQSRKQ
jgi:hypothetical protein